LTIMILFFTIISTYRSRIQILKANSLVPMFVLGPRVKKELGDRIDVEGLEVKAKNMKVKLEIGTGGELRVLDTASGGNNVPLEVL